MGRKMREREDRRLDKFILNVVVVFRGDLRVKSQDVKSEGSREKFKGYKGIYELFVRSQKEVVK